jgi:acetyl esterase/lipase
MPSPQFNAVTQFLKENPTPPNIPPAHQRKTAEAMAAQAPLPDDVYTENIKNDVVSGLLMVAPDVDDQQIILYLHGGGYALGSSLTHRELGWRLSAAAGMRLFLLDYRRAPEHPYPAAVDDAVAAYKWLLESGFSPSSISVAGDSAGGGLTVAMLLVLRNEGVALPKTAVLLSPWLDLTHSSGTFVSNETADLILSAARLREFADWYLGDKASADDPLISPIFADLHGLPPMLIQVGDMEMLLDDSITFAEKAQAAGVDATLDVWEEMFHVWHAIAAIIPEAQEAIEQVGMFMMSSEK